MAVLRFSVSSDWQEVVRLREEINKLENQLKSFGKSTPETQIKQTEERLANTRQEFTRLTTEAARAGAVMENDFKKKIYDASQTVNDLTSKIIAQRDVVRNVEADVRKLGEAYRNAAKSNPYGAGAKRSEYNSARRVLEEERAALFGLTQQQAKAKLSVRQLQEQYALYKRDVGDAAGANNILANSFRRTLAQLGGAVAIKNFVGDVVKATGTMQQLHVALSTILQDGNKASVLIKQLTLFAAKTQFNLEDVAAGAKQLLAYGSSAETVVDELSMLGDVAAGLQIPIGQLIYLYGTLRTQGRAMTVDIRQFAGRGIPIYEELAKVLGVAKDEVSGLVSEGKVGFAEVEQAFKNMTSEGGKFNDLMENSAGTWPQRLSNLGDTLFQKLNDFGNRYKDTIESGFGVTEALVDHLDDVLSVVGSLVIAYGSYKAAVLAVAAVQQVKNWVRIVRVISTYTKAMQGAAVATRALNTAIKANPIGLIAGAIAGLISLISSWTAKQRQAIEEMEEAIRPMQEEYTQVNNLVRKIQDSNTEERERLGLLEELKNIAPDVTKNINDEADALQKLTDNLEVYNNKQLAKIAIKQFGMQSGFEDDYNAYKEAVTSLRRTETQLYNDFAVIYARFADYNKRGAFGSADFTTGGTLDAIINSDKSELEKMQLLINYRRDNKYNDNVRNDMKLLFQGIDFDDYISSLRKARGAEVEYTRSKEKLLEQINNIVRANGGSYELRQELLSLVGLTETPSSTQNDDKKSKVTKESTEEQKREAQKVAEEQKKIKKKLSDELSSMEEENINRDIALMEDGTKKKLRQIDADYNAQKNKISRQAKDWAAMNKNAGITDLNANGLTVSQQSQIDKANELNERERQNRIDNMAEIEAAAMRDIAEIEAAAMRDYLKDYGTFQEQKLAISQLYSEKIYKAETEGEKLALQKEMDEALSALDVDYFKKQINWELIFGDLSAVTKRELDKIKKLLREYRESEEYEGLAVDQKQVIDSALSDIQNAIIEKGGLLGGLPESLKELKAAQEDLTVAQNEYNEALENGTDREIENALQKRNDAQNSVSVANRNVNNSTNTAIRNIQTLAGAIGELGANSKMSLSEVGQLASNVASIFGETGAKVGGIIGAAFSVLDTIGKEGVWGFTQNLNSTLANAARELLEYGTFGLIDFGGLSNRDVDSEVQELTNSNEELVAALDRLTDKMDEASTIEATDLYNRQVENVVQQERNMQRQMYLYGDVHDDGFLGIGGNKSTFYKINQSMSLNDWNEISRIVGKSVTSAEAFFRLSSEDMAKVADEATSIYAKIKESADDGARDIAQYMDDYIKLHEQLEDLEDAYNEKLTSTTFDSMREDFKNALNGMMDDTDDAAKYIQESFKNAILESLISSNYDESIKKLYKDFAAAMSDGNLSSEEYNRLQSIWENLVNQAASEYEQLMNIVGIPSNNTEEQQATSGYQTTLSEDTGSIIVGRATSIQMAVEDIRVNEKEKMVVLTDIRTSIGLLYDNSKTSQNIANETRDILANSYLELQQISSNTESIIKPIRQIQADMAVIKENTGRL